MYNLYPSKRFDLFIVIFIALGIFVIISHIPSIIYAWGPENPSGPGFRQDMYPNPGFGPGFMQGSGLRRGFGFGIGAGSGGLHLQRGILQEPLYCKMLMDRTDLNLTSEQKEALRQLQLNYTKETGDLRADLQIAKIELRKLRFAQDPNFNNIKKKLENISKLQLELQLKRARLQIDADKLLTREQKDSLYLSPDMAVDIDWDVSMDLEEKSEAGL
ncbi:periplasmic heavy metal sensor [bacterium]|nr:periplasmic heavy metal sensor [bacterium]